MAADSKLMARALERFRADKERREAEHRRQVAEVYRKVPRAEEITRRAEDRAAKLKADTRQWLERLERGYDLLRTDMDATVSHTANELERVQHSLQGVAADFETYDRRLEELIKAYQEGEN